MAGECPRGTRPSIAGRKSWEALSLVIKPFRDIGLQRPFDTHRRAHDCDVPGWVGCPPVLVVLGTLWWAGQLPGQQDFDIPGIYDPIRLIAVLAFWGLALWTPSEGANRYGPDPRALAAPAQ